MTTILFVTLPKIFKHCSILLKLINYSLCKVVLNCPLDLQHNFVEETKLEYIKIESSIKTNIQKPGITFLKILQHHVEIFIHATFLKYILFLLKTFYFQRASYIQKKKLVANSKKKSSRKVKYNNVLLTNIDTFMVQ